MTAEIVDLSSKRLAPFRGNGAREATIDVALGLPNDTSLPDAEMWADWLLAELWARGFKVVPVA
jgi:hypothetical protein